MRESENLDYFHPFFGFMSSSRGCLLIRTEDLPSRSGATGNTILSRRHHDDDDDKDDDVRPMMVWFNITDNAYNHYQSTGTTIGASLANAASTSRGELCSSRETELLPPYRKKRRPLPSSQALITSVNPREKGPIPLLEHYRQFRGESGEPVVTPVTAVKEAVPADGRHHQQQQEEGVEGSETSMIHAASIDDSRCSTLSRRQHVRYLQLKHRVRPRSTWKESDQKEFSRLQKLVRTEQERYREALLAFWQARHSDRLMVGFRTQIGGRASAFAELAARTSVLLQRSGVTVENETYGRCCQVIAIRTLDDPREHSSTGRAFSLDSLSVQVLQTVGQSISCPQLPSCGGVIPEPLPARLRTLSRMQDDVTALDLAKLHGADVVTAVETLRVILQDPFQCEWVIPVVRTDPASNIAILDLPIPQVYPSPRACLTDGFQEGLQQWVLNESGSAVTGGSSGQRRYVLLVLPRRGNKQGRVLVRMDSLLSVASEEDDGDDEHHHPRPLHLQAHVEYFPDRGREIPSSYEKALWLLYQVLQPGSKVVIGRIDPCKATLLNWEDVSLAHALVPEADWSDTSPHSEASPMDLFRTMIHILQSVPTIGPGTHHLMCMPDRREVRAAGVAAATATTRAISVHKQTAASNQATIIRVIDEQKRAGEVLVSRRALQECFRPWKWENHEQVPYTFPPQDARTE